MTTRTLLLIVGKHMPNEFSIVFRSELTFLIFCSANTFNSRRRNITVYSSNLAAFTIHHDNNKGSSGPDLLLSYHDNDHYNSVRLNNMNGNKLVTASKLYERSNYHNSAINTVDISEKNDSHSDQTTDTTSGGRSLQQQHQHHQHQLDDEMSTTDTESSRLSGNTASTSGTNVTATTAATGYSTTSTSTNMSTSSTCSLQHDCDQTQQELTDDKATSVLNINKKQKSSKVKPEKKKRSISRMNLLRGYHKVNSDMDDEEEVYDGEQDSLDQISEDGGGGGTVQTNDSKSIRSSRPKKEKRKKDATASSSSTTNNTSSVTASSDDDDFVKKGHFRVLKI